MPAVHERYVIGTWVRVQTEDGPTNQMSLSIDHPGLLGITDATDQSGRLIADGHQCVFRVQCNDKQLAALEADDRYTVFPVEGEATLTEKLAIDKHGIKGSGLPPGTKRELVKAMLVTTFRQQGIKELADQELAKAIADEAIQRSNRELQQAQGFDLAAYEAAAEQLNEAVEAGRVTVTT